MYKLLHITNNIRTLRIGIATILITILAIGATYANGFSDIEATIEITNTQTTYDGDPKHVAVTTNPAGLNYTVTYNSSTQPPINVGQYSVVVTIAHAGFTGSATSTLDIQPAQATISLSDTVQTYDGNFKTVLAETTPPGLSIRAVYDGLNSPPTTPGTYPVTVTVTNTNYTGSQSGTLRIKKAPATLFVSDTIQTYDGASKRPTVSTEPADLGLRITYDGSEIPPRDAGTYSTVIAVENPYYSASKTVNLKINPASGIVVIAGTQAVYDGNAKPVTVTTVPPNLAVSVTYNGNTSIPASAGLYSVIASINENNYAGSSQASLTIDKATATITFTDTTKTYTGLELEPDYVTDPPNLNVNLTFDNTDQQPTQTGNYKVTATINDRDYTGNDSTTLVIEKAEAQIIRSDTITTYNGLPQSPTISTIPQGLSFSVSYDDETSKPINADTIDVIITVNDPNYEKVDSSKFIIKKAPQTITFGRIEDRPIDAPPLELSGSSSSGLTLTYSVSPESPAQVNGNTLTLSMPGAVTVTAKQDGNDNYLKADSVTQIFAALSPYSQIKGKIVDFDGTIIDYGSVTLFRDTLDSYVPFATTNLTTSGYSVKAPGGKYILRYNAPDTSRFINTYLGTSVIWQDAESITVSEAKDLSFFIPELRPEVNPGHVTVSGQYVSEDNGNFTPIPNIVLLLLYPETERIYDVLRTDETGKFEFNRIKYGNYTLQVDKPTGKKNRLSPLLQLSQNIDSLEIRVIEQAQGIKVEVLKAHQVLDAQNLDDKIKISPNPATNWIRITKDTQSNTQFSGQILSVSGKSVCKFSSLSSGEKLDLSHFPQGVFIIEIHSKDEIIRRKIFKR
ncbi:hypothetical protein FUAX_22800 [Fulvitalea axinellae]|uniref:T9SS type A sorting domain-containing protein n=1 Tax=Fulvitalea axinellae TaxID=1182444 RepID=A0AAU9D1P7_9BACT|nr:hypothetical protein FUAX_22800 [Fulvitalea axinellae]